jgi:hypothetical protein
VGREDEANKEIDVPSNPSAFFLRVLRILHGFSPKDLDVQVFLNAYFGSME